MTMLRKESGEMANKSKLKLAVGADEEPSQLLASEA